MRQLFTESTILALAGGAVGLLIAFWGLAAITKLLPADFPRLNEIHMDLRVLGFTFAASVLTGILFGLAPALQISRSDVQEAIRETGRGTIGKSSSKSFSPGAHRGRGGFVGRVARRCRPVVQKFPPASISKHRIRLATSVDCKADARRNKLS